jgi:hypothetical protein
LVLDIERLEPLKDFIFSAQRAQKIAREKDNGEDLKIFAKNAGSNYFLRNRRLEFSWQDPYKALAAPAPAASATDENRFLCSIYAQIRTFFKSQR